MIRTDANEHFTGSVDTITDEDIDAILEKSVKKTNELNAKYDDDARKPNFFDLAFDTEDSTDWKEQQRQFHMPWIEPPKRERKTQFDFSEMAERLGLKEASDETKQKAKKTPYPEGYVKTYDFQFYPSRFIELQKREVNAFWKSVNFVPELKEYLSKEAAEKELQQDLADIEAAVPLNTKEIREKEKLYAQGFPNWNRKDFSAYIKALGEFEKTDVENIAAAVSSKSVEEVKAYNDVFWQRHCELATAADLMRRLEKSHNKLQAKSDERIALHEKMRQYQFPRWQLKVNYNDANLKTNPFGVLADRLMLYHIWKIGLDTPGAYGLLKDRIADDPDLVLDWHVQSRSEAELEKRINTLLGFLKREFETDDRVEMYNDEWRFWERYGLGYGRAEVVERGKTKFTGMKDKHYHSDASDDEHVIEPRKKKLKKSKK